MNFTGLPPESHALLRPPLPGAPLVEVRWRWACGLETAIVDAGHTAVLSFEHGYAVTIDREPLALTFDIPGPAGDQLAHPLLTTPAAVLARWLGNVTLHGGAFEHEGRAWAVLADKGGGKSSTLGALAVRGVPILTDDLVVVDGAGRTHAGPACVDLRTEASQRLGVGRDLGTVTRERFRVSVEPAGDALPLGGFFLLGWSDADDVAVAPVPLARRMPELFAHEMGPIGRQDPVGLLQLAPLPMWFVRRRQAWETVDATVDTLLGLSR